MKTHLARVVGILLLLVSMISAEELVIGDFPLGVGGSVQPSFFNPYAAQLQAISDSLKANPGLVIVITGSADSHRYRTSNDAKNPGLALGRAHVVRNHLIGRFGIDSLRIVIQSSEAELPGGQHRSVRVRLESIATQAVPGLIDTVVLASPAPVIERTEVTDLVPSDLGLRLGAGVATSPFGGIPIVTGAVSWKKAVFVEGTFGHTFWSRPYTYQTIELDTWRRMSGGLLAVYPKKSLPIAAVGGWIRVEQISQQYYEYVKLSEGIMVGLRGHPLDFLTVTATYNPSRHRLADLVRSRAKNGQFMLSLTAHVDVGGAR